MDINTLRGLITALLIVIFIALFIWAYSKNRQSAFDEAAMLPLLEDNKIPDPHSSTQNRASTENSNDSHPENKHPRKQAKTPQVKPYE